MSEMIIAAPIIGSTNQIFGVQEHLHCQSIKHTPDLDCHTLSVMGSTYFANCHLRIYKEKLSNTGTTAIVGTYH